MAVTPERVYEVRTTHKMETHLRAVSRLICCARARTHACTHTTLLTCWRLQVWRGRNMFFCGGRIMTGPRINPIVWSLIMMLLPFVLYLSSTYGPTTHTPTLHTHTRCRCSPLTLLILNLASHKHTHHRDYWVRHRLGTVVPPLVVSIMFVYCLVEFLATAFADPGIIPRSHRNHKHAYRRPRPPRVQVTDCAPPPLAAATSHFWYGSLQFGAHRLRWCRVCVSCVVHRTCRSLLWQAGAMWSCSTVTRASSLARHAQSTALCATIVSLSLM